VLAAEPRPSWTATAAEDAALDRDLALGDIFDMDLPKVMKTAYTSRLGRVLLHLVRYGPEPTGGCGGFGRGGGGWTGATADQPAWSTGRPWGPPPPHPPLRSTPSLPADAPPEHVQWLEVVRHEACQSLALGRDFIFPTVEDQRALLLAALAALDGADAAAAARAGELLAWWLHYDGTTPSDPLDKAPSAPLHTMFRRRWPSAHVLASDLPQLLPKLLEAEAARIAPTLEAALARADPFSRGPAEPERAASAVTAHAAVGVGSVRGACLRTWTLWLWHSVLAADGDLTSTPDAAPDDRGRARERTHSNEDERPDEGQAARPAKPAAWEEPSPAAAAAAAAGRRAALQLACQVRPRRFTAPRACIPRAHAPRDPRMVRANGCLRLRRCWTRPCCAASASFRRRSGWRSTYRRPPRRRFWPTCATRRWCVGRACAAASVAQDRC